MPTCDFCGKTLGNAGAKTTHERSCDDNPANQQGAAAAEPAQPAQPEGQPQQGRRDRQPINPSKQAQRQMQGGQQQAGGQQAQAPQTVEQAPQQQETQMQTPEQAEGAGSFGAAGAELLANLDADDPETRAQATSMLTEAVAGGVKHLGKKKAQQMLDEHNRAKKGAGQTADPVDDVVDCGECGKPIDRLPNAERFNCPYCHTTLRNPLWE